MLVNQATPEPSRVAWSYTRCSHWSSRGQTPLSTINFRHVCPAPSSAPHGAHRWVHAWSGLGERRQQPTWFTPGRRSRRCPADDPRVVRRVHSTPPPPRIRSRRRRLLVAASYLTPPRPMSILRASPAPLSRMPPTLTNPCAVVARNREDRWWSARWHARPASPVMCPF